MDNSLREQLTVKVHLLPEPSLWYWEITEAGDGGLVESSWATQWLGYESSREALCAGLGRITELTRRQRGAGLHGRLTPPRPRYLVVVARNAVELCASLKRTFADSDRIEVILDRRHGERRQRNEAVRVDRRRANRRSAIQAATQVRWCEWSSGPTVSVSGTPSAHQRDVS